MTLNEIIQQIKIIKATTQAVSSQSITALNACGEIPGINSEVHMLADSLIKAINDAEALEQALKQKQGRAA